MMTPGRQSPDMDVDNRYDKAQKTWEKVLENKHRETEEKNKNTKKLLAKKFKREKEMEKKAKELAEVKQYDDEKRAELVFNNMERKKQQDMKLEQKKRKELLDSQKKSQLVNQRRTELLNERGSLRGLQSSRALPAVNGSQDGIGGPRDSAANIAPMKQRAFSSTGRTQEQFRKLHEIEEFEAIQSGLQRYESKMRKATELRAKILADESSNMHNRVQKVGEKLTFKSLAAENEYQEQFRKNILKRDGMEQKKKKRAEER